MDYRLSRQSLYDLVWSEPISKVAARYGISGAAFAKTCHRYDIPVPPRGYWAQLHAGKRQVLKRALPPRSLGGTDNVEFGRRHWRLNVISDADLMTMELPPLREFTESVADLTTRVQRMVKRVHIPKDLSKPHRLIAKLLESEEAGRKARPYFSMPLFDSPFEQRRLRFLSGLFTALGQAGMRPRFSGKDPSDFSVQVGEQHVSFTLDKPGAGNRFGFRSEEDTRTLASAPLKLEVGSVRDLDGVVTCWQDKVGDRIERRATEIAIALIVRGELQHRRSEQRHFDWLVGRKINAIEDARKRLEAELRAEREARVRKENARVQRLLDEAAAYRQASDIRAYVETVRSARAGSGFRATPEEMEGWATWAIDQADRIDPVRSGSFLLELD